VTLVANGRTNYQLTFEDAMIFAAVQDSAYLLVTEEGNMLLMLTVGMNRLK